MTFEEIGDRVEVMALFPAGGGLKLLKIRWRQRVVKVKRSISQRKERVGDLDRMIHVVQGDTGDVYELGFYPERQEWVLLRVGMEG